MKRILGQKALAFILTLALFPMGMWAYELRYITTREGLTNSSVLSLCLKTNGQLAVGTCDGVNGFDGYSAWRIVPEFGDTPLHGNIVEDMSEGRGEVLWVLTNHGLNRFDNLQGISNAFFPKTAGCKRIRRNPEKDIFLLSDGLIYCTCDGSDTLQELILPDVKENEVLEYTLSQDNIWIFTCKGISRYRLNRTDKGYVIDGPVAVLAKPIVHASADEGNVYYVTEGGMLYSFDIVTEDARPLMSLADELKGNGKISQILVYKEQIVVSFANDGFIFFKRGADGRYSKTLQKRGVGILTMQKDLQNDVLWMGSDGSGLIMCHDPRYKHQSITYKDLNIDFAKPVRAVLSGRDSDLWIGTKGGGIIALDNVESGGDFTGNRAGYAVYTTANSPLGSNLVYAFAGSETEEGFWICHEEGLDFYSYRHQRIMPVTMETESEKLPLKRLSAAYEHKGTLWLTSMGGGVYEARVAVKDGMVQLKDIQRYVLHDGKVASNYFMGLGHNDKGDIWFANRGMGVCQVKDGKLQRVRYHNTYVDSSVNDVFAVTSCNGDWWIGTGAGIIVRKSDGTEKLLTMSDGLPNNTIHAFMADGDGRIFATTNNGIACFSKGSLTPTVLSSDMEVMEYSDGAVSKCGDTFFFGGVNGLSVLHFNPDVSGRSIPKRLDFISLKVFNENVSICDFIDYGGKCPRLSLNHNQNSISLRVSAMDYAQAADLQYAYRIHDNEGWIFADNTNIVNLAQLLPGDYTLQIKYINRITNEESPVFLLDICMDDPWFSSWLAWIVYFLIFLTVVYVLIKVWWHRVKSEQQLQLMIHQKELTDKVYEEKMNFLTNVVHELNTPLTLILGPCERIKSYASNDAYISKYVKLIVQNLGRLNTLLQEIMDFRRITTGHHKIEVHRVDVTSFVEDIIVAFNELAKDNHITFECEVSQGVIWNTDERALLRIVNNLVSNAFKYTKQNGCIRLNMSADNIGETENPMLRISVYNTGKGISPEQQTKIFDYYTVFDNVNESEVRGLTARNGLGMSICYKMVKKLNGTITIDSQVGEYAQFDVALPMQPLSEGVSDEVVDAKALTNSLVNRTSADEMVSDQSLSLTANNLKGDRFNKNKKTDIVPVKKDESEAYTILIVDDNVDILNMLADCLEGYHVVKAKSAEEGFERMKDMLPDLIITDIMMPDINGLDFTSSVKKNKHTMHIPLIILSAKNSEDERIEGLGSGADIYISKPFNINYLLMTIRRLLENSKMLKEYYTTSASSFTFMGGKLVKNEERDFMNEVSRILSENLMNTQFSPDDLAQELLISSRNLYRKFSELGLPTPNNYIKKYKIEMAAKLILTTDMTIQEIIYNLGFNTRSQFYSEFRKYYSMTPKQYREKYTVRNESLEA